MHGEKLKFIYERNRFPEDHIHSRFILKAVFQYYLKISVIKENKGCNDL